MPGQASRRSAEMRYWHWGRCRAYLARLLQVPRPQGYLPPRSAWLRHKRKWFLKQERRCSPWPAAQRRDSHRRPVDGEVAARGGFPMRKRS